MPGIAPFKIPLAGINVTGSYKSDLPGTVYGNRRTFGDVTNFNGWFVVLDGRIPAVWTSGVVDPNVPPVCSANVLDFNVTLENRSLDWICPKIVNGAIPAFSIASALPPALSINASGYSTGYGMPYLNLYGSDGLYISSKSSSAVSADGTNATFPFPTQAGGGSLASGLYTFNIWNPGPYAQALFLGGGFFSVGSNDTSMQTPYGVDAGNVTVSTWWCDPGTGGTRCAGPSYTSTVTTPTPILTRSSANQAVYSDQTYATGTQPVAVKLYGSATVSISNTPTFRQSRTGPSKAIVVNFGSNSVSILNLVNNTVTTTMGVGAKPSAVTINSSATKAYVANYGSSSIWEIDLTSNTQSRVASVGAQPAAIAMDPGGTAIWVGGYNYISKIDLSSFSAIQTFSVSGQVTSMAVSSGQNSLVYTTVATAGGSTTFTAQQAAISNAAIQGTYAQYTMSSSSYYYAQEITSGGPAPGAPGWLMSSGALVSANYGNGAAVVGTPTGFAVLDLVAKTQIMQGNTPSAVRGIATNPSQGIVYLAAPDSNSFITVPLPAPQ